jgi:hypothetical protein
MLLAVLPAFTWGGATLAEEESGPSCAPKISGIARERGPRIEALHQARDRGDMAAFRALEAQAQRKEGGLETDCDIVLRPSTSIGFVGDPMDQIPGLPKKEGMAAPAGATFGSDVHIGWYNSWTSEWYHSMASDSKGNLYVAWQDDWYPDNFISVKRSTDGGETWEDFGGIFNPVYDVKHPSIAVGQGSNGDTLLLAYIVDNVYGAPYPEVATTHLDFPVFSFHSIPYWGSWEEYCEPQIITDSNKYSAWFAYLTCEAIVDYVGINKNTCCWRSTDGGSTWTSGTVPFGNTDDYTWMDPDITFGTTQNRLVLVNFNADDHTMYTMTSDDFGYSWNPAVPFYTMTSPSFHAANPEIAAAAHHDHVMICCTKFTVMGDDIGQGYSTDAGDTWSTCWSLNGSTGHDEFAPALTANECGGSWHLTYTTEQTASVHYSRRPQDLSGYWQPIPDTVDDRRCACLQGHYALKGIASNWATDVACIAWADTRDLDPDDTETYCDNGINLGIMVDRCSIEEYYGGKIEFTLNAGATNMGRSYILLGGVSGIDPGTPLPGGEVLPLNWDAFTDVMLTLMNTYVFDNFMHQLNADGMAIATLNAPPVPGYGGYDIYFAFTLYNPFNYVSNAVTIPIMP